MELYNAFVVETKIVKLKMFSPRRGPFSGMKFMHFGDYMVTDSKWISPIPSKLNRKDPRDGFYSASTFCGHHLIFSKLP